MKKIMIAAMALSLLPAGAIFAQDTNSTMSSTTTKKHKHHKSKKSKSTMSSTTGAK